MKKILLTTSLICFSFVTYANKVCTHDDFARKWPSDARRLGNCPGDTPAGYTASCLDNYGSVIRLYCHPSNGWVPLGGKINVQTNVLQKEQEDKVDGEIQNIDQEESLILDQ
jgi:hypothetical protein